MTKELFTQAERACLAIADISGYTGYLAESELDHAHDVLADLMETVVSGIRPVFRLAKLEGDAAFAYTTGLKLDGSILLDTMEGCYFAFRRRLQSILQATTCPCNACAGIPQLNLKFFLHHGAFVRHRIAGREELAGTDVILVHRLLKNSVTKTLGLHGYGLFTAPCLSAIGVDPTTMGMREHRESYDHIGEVQAYVHDLEARWERDRESRRVVVDPERAEVDMAMPLPAPPPVVWDYLTSPSKRAQYAGADRVDQVSPSGRRGIGTTTHCVHGHGTIVEEILDWRPFQYFTIQARFPGLVGTVKYMFELTPTPSGGTMLRFCMEKIRNRKQMEQWRGLRDQWAANFQQTAQRLTATLAEEMTRHGLEGDATPTPTH